MPIPERGAIESFEGQMGLSIEFVKFLRRTLTWMPSERATAKDLLGDPWLKAETLIIESCTLSTLTEQ